MAIKKFLLAFLPASLGLSKTEVEEYITKIEEGDEEAAAELLTNHKARVADLKKTAFDDGHKKAAKTTLTKLESDVREKFGIESEKQGLDLIEELVSAKAAPAESKTLTDEDVKKTPVYLDLEKRFTKAEKQFEARVQDEVKKVQETYTQKETVKAVAEKALDKFLKLNPILSPDATKAERQKANFRKQIEAGTYKVEGDTILILNADGSRKEDDHGNPIKFEDYVQGTADDLGFDYKAAEDRNSSGGGSNGGAGGLGNQGGTGSEKKYTGKLPTNESEYSALMFDPTLTVDQQAEIQAHWTESSSTK